MDFDGTRHTRDTLINQKKKDETKINKVRIKTEMSINKVRIRRKWVLIKYVLDGNEY